MNSMNGSAIISGRSIFVEDGVQEQRSYVGSYLVEHMDFSYLMFDRLFCTRRQHLPNLHSVGTYIRSLQKRPKQNGWTILGESCYQKVQSNNYKIQ